MVALFYYRNINGVEKMKKIIFLTLILNFNKFEITVFIVQQEIG